MTKVFNFSCGCQITENFDINHIPLDCPLTWKLIQSGKTLGIFQLETPLGQNWAKKSKPCIIKELAELGALLRPGCLDTGMTKKYVDIKSGKDSINILHESLESSLGSTYGVLVYQEQIIEIAIKLAGFSLQEADSLRKGIGKKNQETISEIESSFISGCANVGIVDEETAKTIFGWIRESARYLFNKSHAIAYALTGYQTAYLKAHFPLQFYCSWLNFSGEKIKPKEEVARLYYDAKNNGISIKNPDLRKKNLDFIIDGESIYFGLGHIAFIGESSGPQLLRTIEDLENSLEKRLENWTWNNILLELFPKINSQVTNSLIFSGALDYLGIPRNKMYYEYKKLCELTEKEYLFIKSINAGQSLSELISLAAKPKKFGGGASNVNRVSYLLDLKKTLDTPSFCVEDSYNSISDAETKLMGVSISASGIEDCDTVSATHNCSQISHIKEGKFILGAEIEGFKSHKIKTGPNKGDDMAFIRLKDSSGVIDVCAFTDALDEYKDLLTDGNKILAFCEKKPRGINIYKVKQLFLQEST